MAASQPPPAPAVVHTHSVVHPPSPASSSKPSSSSKVKPINVFSDDGSFLERLQRNKRVRPYLHLLSKFMLTILLGGRGEEAGRGSDSKVSMVRLIDLFRHTCLTLLPYSAGNAILMIAL